MCYWNRQRCHSSATDAGGMGGFGFKVGSKYGITIYGCKSVTYSSIDVMVYSVCLDTRAPEDMVHDKCT
jgi:hypothetical protein